MIRFGPGGTGGNSLKGIPEIKAAGLHAVELEFTHGVNMGIPKAKQVGKVIQETGLIASIHAPYFINLASVEEKKITASKERILASCERGHYLGANFIVFHPGYYGTREPEDVYDMIKKAMIEMHRTIKEKGWNVTLAPETTGKHSQFGRLDELLRLRKETGCHLTVDFSHLRAINNGPIDYAAVFDKLKGIKLLHCHFSGIEYTEKGERRHLLTKKSDFVPLFKEAIKRNVDMVIINESPDPRGDSIKGMKLYQAMRQ